MTGYLRAARACHTLAVLAALVTAWLIHAGHPWWAALAGWAAFLAVFFGCCCHLAHHRTLTDRTIRTRYALTNKENPTA